MHTHGRVTPGPVGLPAFRSSNDQRPRRAAVGRCVQDRQLPIRCCTLHLRTRSGGTCEQAQDWRYRPPLRVPPWLGEGAFSGGSRVGNGTAVTAVVYKVKSGAPAVRRRAVWALGRRPRRARGRPAQAPCVRAPACPAGGHAVRPSAGRGERRRERSKVTGAGTSARRPSGIRSPAAREPLAPPDELRSAGPCPHRRARPDKDPRSDSASSASRRSPATAATGTV